MCSQILLAFLLNITVCLRCITSIKHSLLTLHCSETVCLFTESISIIYCLDFPGAEAVVLGPCDSTFPVAECSDTQWTERVCAAIWRQGTLLLYHPGNCKTPNENKCDYFSFPHSLFLFLFFVSLQFLSKCNSLPRLLLKFHTRDCHANQNIIICSLLISFCCNVHVFLLSMCPATESTGTNRRRVLFQFDCNLLSWKQIYIFLY